jgi:hypothetical protein
MKAFAYPQAALDGRHWAGQGADEFLNLVSKPI